MLNPCNNSRHTKISGSEIKRKMVSKRCRILSLLQGVGWVHGILTQRWLAAERQQSITSTAGPGKPVNGDPPNPEVPSLIHRNLHAISHLGTGPIDRVHWKFEDTRCLQGYPGHTKGAKVLLDVNHLSIPTEKNKINRK
jgi:hypothetical protein